MTERTSHLAGLWIGAAISPTRLTQTKPVLPPSNEHGSQVKDQGRRQCCHNKHKKFPYRPIRGVSLLSGHASYNTLQLSLYNCSPRFSSCTQRHNTSWTHRLEPEWGPTFMSAPSTFDDNFPPLTWPRSSVMNTVGFTSHVSSEGHLMTCLCRHREVRRRCVSKPYATWH